MVESDIYNIVHFIRDCDVAYENGNITFDMIKQARVYLKKIRSIPTNDKTALINALSDKLLFILKIYRAGIVNSNSNNDVVRTSASINLINYSLTDFIIHLVKENRLTDSKLIARFVYLELSKHLYYDISYTQIQDLERKRIIVDTPIDVKNAKIFSYIVCTQWLQLYTYILSQFGINVKKMNIPGQDHVWGEIDLRNGNIIIVDAADYLGSSIDLSNAKSNSPTRGFVIAPKEFSGVRLGDLYKDIRCKDIKDRLAPYYEQNRDLDIELGYIDSKGYPSEIILRENELFQNTNKFFYNNKDMIKFLKEAKKFLINLYIPNNIDGYEIFAYYHMFVEKMPPQIRGNIAMKTLYADTFNYKQNKVKNRRLEAPEEYLRYLQDLIYNRYYQYLSNDEYNKLFSKVYDGTLSNETLGEKALEQEMLVAQINRRLNPYYAINELKIYNPEDYFDSTYLLYEPSSGNKVFNNEDAAKQYMIENKIK